MLISQEAVLNCLGRELRPEDQKKHFSLICRLTWLGVAVLEFGFQCKKDQREPGKKWFLAFLQQEGDAVVLCYAAHYEFVDLFADGGDDELEVEDLALVLDACRELAMTGPLTREKLLEWIRKAWAFGVRQQEIYSMEVEGGIMNELGMILHFGTSLAMWGESEGYLPSLVTT